MNIVTIDRITELSDNKTRHEKLKIILWNWKMVAIISVALLTAKVGAEQLVMLIRH
jgi:hypothetical protein